MHAFNVRHTGTGSVLNANGEIEMDSIIMDGQSLQVGAVTCVQNIANPVSLARKVMEEVRARHSYKNSNKK